LLAFFTNARCFVDTLHFQASLISDRR